MILTEADQELAEATPVPGTNAAIESGCTCPVLDNGHGRGYMGQAGVYIFNCDCPLHNSPGMMGGIADVASKYDADTQVVSNEM